MDHGVLDRGRNYRRALIGFNVSGLQIAADSIERGYFVRGIKRRFRPTTW